jgi:hypothetical protein
MKHQLSSGLTDFNLDDGADLAKDVKSMDKLLKVTVPVGKKELKSVKSD